MKHQRIFMLSILMVLGHCSLNAQVTTTDAAALFLKLRNKVLLVKDYTAQVRLKIDVNNMRIPPLNGILYFKNPGKMRLVRKGGISILPKRSTNLTLSNLIPDGEPTVIDLGTAVVQGVNTRVLQVVPKGESDIVLTKLWVDEARLLTLQTETTTRDNGTVKMALQYGNFIHLGLPDAVTFLLDVKEYKLPKGVTMDYDEGDKTGLKGIKEDDGKRKKGRIDIQYKSYEVNTGLSDAVFEE